MRKPQGVTRFLKRCVSDVKLQIGSERITNELEGKVVQSDHAILSDYVEKRFPSSKNIRVHEPRCYKRDHASVSVDFGCREPSHNHEDETPSTKCARLLPRFWKDNERIY